MFNLPPGCSVNDLPGNSIREVELEKWLDTHFADPDLLEKHLEDTFIDVSKLTPETILEVCQAGGPKYIEFLEGCCDECD
jgi:hypothetical protein